MKLLFTFKKFGHWTGRQVLRIFSKTMRVPFHNLPLSILRHYHLSSVSVGWYTTVSHWMEGSQSNLWDGKAAGAWGKQRAVKRISILVSALEGKGQRESRNSNVTCFTVLKKASWLWLQVIMKHCSMTP